jgi:phosphatidate phosphatase APP1
MNDPIKVRQHGGVLEFVQCAASRSGYSAKRDGHVYVTSLSGSKQVRHLSVYCDGKELEQIVVSDYRGESASPTTLFAIAETIHARLTGREQTARAESVNAELLEALGLVLDLEEKYLPADYGYTTFSESDFEDVMVKVRAAIARAEAQQ